MRCARLTACPAFRRVAQRRSYRNATRFAQPLGSRFEGEAKAVTALSHPNLLALYAFDFTAVIADKYPRGQSATILLQ
jgi:hypothetical protein